MRNFIKLAFVSYWILVSVFIGAKVYIDNFSQQAMERKVREIYAAVAVQTGQMQDILPLEIINKNIINAFNNGQKVVVYTGLIDTTESWDEVALVLGHEIAHGTLGHLGMELSDVSQVAKLEGNADKMGAVYMMKAGYDVCVGREIFKRWKQSNGNGLGQDHPSNSYRYEELNINCGE